jgi:hypothetical protein
MGASEPEIPVGLMLFSYTQTETRVRADYTDLLYSNFEYQVNQKILPPNRPPGEK